MTSTKGKKWKQISLCSELLCCSPLLMCSSWVDSPGTEVSSPLLLQQSCCFRPASICVMRVWVLLFCLHQHSLVQIEKCNNQVIALWEKEAAAAAEKREELIERKKERRKEGMGKKGEEGSSSKTGNQDNRWKEVEERSWFPSFCLCFFLPFLLLFV